jgi:hypothetical protein
MNPPRIVSAIAIDDTTLLIEFSNHDRKQYCIKHLLDKPMFLLLQNPSFFRSFQIDDGGYGIIWNDEMDLSEYELWRNGTNIVADDSRFSIQAAAQTIAIVPG